MVLSCMQWLITTIWTIATSPVRLLQWSLSSGKAEAYTSLDHLALNVVSPQTEWLNMGNWQATGDFPTACHHLAMLLYQEAGVYNEASVLDVGHASGDSLLLLASEYSPTILHGVTSLRSHTLRARARMQEQMVRLQGLTSLSWHVFHDDAVAFLAQNNGTKYDFILALDCAYHFHTRKDFLNACSSRLNPGGKVALVDLIAAHPYPKVKSSSLYFTPSPELPPPTLSKGGHFSLLKHKIITLVSGVPIGNLISVEQYHRDLQDAGFDGVTIKDISHLVFPGFAKFLKHLGKGDEAPWRGGGRLQTIALNSFGSVVESWSKGGQDGMVRCVVVVATSSGTTQ
ncbi:hypothetical protein CBS101457_004044 [Exobasidium rhododendri]|nr:hypothetical protein CBS101457_004044 [Exobasidium rhododendri]